MSDLTPPLSIKVSDHILLKEVTCRCWGRPSGALCTGGIVDRRLMDVFEDIRRSVSFYTAHNTPIHISSGYRCPQWNDLVGGSPSSYHKLGMAMDLHTPKGVGYQQFVDIVFSHHRENGGVLLYDWGTHIDLGPKRLIDMRK